MLIVSGGALNFRQSLSVKRLDTFLLLDNAIVENVCGRLLSLFFEEGSFPYENCV